MKRISHYSDINAYTTKDESEIRELMHPETHGNKLQSLAEAIIKPGKKTLLHRHLKTEELYFVIQGEGRLQLDAERLSVNEGDTICIPPETEHCIENIGEIDLKILCCCSPAYSHEDTILS